MIYIELFLIYFKVGLFSFGGGYASLPLIKEEIITTRGYMTMTEFADVLTISEMTPGPIAINCATFVGTQVGGILGAISATLGFVAPSLIISLILAYFFYKYQNLKIVNQILSVLRPVVVGIIASVAFTLFYSNVMGGTLSIDFVSLILFGISFILLTKFKFKIYTVMAIVAVLGIIMY